ncbi:TetR family transcriptional regulator [Streptomyces sp. CB09001]|uniref:TetR family transcriptional regulator n=1 Tax=unclassified Streptomyces TaxID=2593676 RepID=UPI000E2146BA|nr:TetR family transcriptional regulator [Streptomyces sp. CB09001]AXL87126.1 TetR family transcriptional regulator [Streptomyces sp. CB09001]
MTEEREWRRVRSDGQATRRRLLDAAAREFADHGIAGTRVDRIAKQARANKSQLYSHFPSKEALFDAVLAEHVDALTDVVRLTPHDLPGYAVRLYDAYLADPAVVRLATWNRLERRPVGALFPNNGDSAKIAALVERQEDGTLNSDIDAQDVHSMVIAMAMTWSAASITTTGTASEGQQIHHRRRASLREAVRRAFVDRPDV